MADVSILFIEDDRAGRELGTYNLEQAGYRVDAADSGERGLELFDPSRHELVITDLRMPGASGLDVLEAVKSRSPETPVLVITAYGSVDVAVEAMRAGAHDFVGKPFNRDHLLVTVERALETRQLRDEVRSLRQRAAGERPIVGSSEALRAVLEVADRVAPANATVLVTGETGTGKELIARRIHAVGPRAAAPFVAINCAAVPQDLLESELFGHERGAFTGASRARRGRFREADGGTLFLDEVAELPIDLQGKLLRVLQEHVVDVLGSDRPVPVDVRVIAATNKDLLDLTRTGRFREDLLYRLNVVEIRVPPLRERREEIPELARHFIAGFARGRELSVPDELLAELERRTWPGNVRQLENACERLVILCPGDTLRVDDLPPREHGEAPEVQLDDWPPLPEGGLSLVDLEKRVIERVLELKNGNITHAAEYLGVPRHVLAYRLVKYGLRRDD